MALFILIYIVIVGPLDYILLTRVFKKPELTWVTFPVVVISLSVLVYLVAYSMKGDDLRVEKIDLVEYDLGAPHRAYGTSWFTLFSPRIQNYTVGLEPSTPGWASPPPEGSTGRATLTTLVHAGQSADATGSPSLFRKPYDYAEDASGLERVPIPVWSTRTFQASWSAAIDKDAPPVQNGGADKAKPDLVRTERGDPAKVFGTIRNNLAVPLQSVTIFYKGKYYLAANDLAPGETFNVQTLFAPGKIGRADGQGLPASGWAADGSVLAPTVPAAGDSELNGFTGQDMLRLRTRSQLMKDLLFHAKTASAAKTNAGLRLFDQSWRLDGKNVVGVPGAAPPVFRDEIILVARTPTLADRADAVAQDPGCPTRLWIDRLPDGNSKPPSEPGYLTQETYVRVYIPVLHPKTDRADKP